MNRPFVTVCPECESKGDGRYTGRKRSRLVANADRERHREYYDCDSVRVEERPGEEQ